VLLSFIPAVLATQWGVILREENYLNEKFGEGYSSFASKVRRWLRRSDLTHKTSGHEQLLPGNLAVGMASVAAAGLRLKFRGQTYFGKTVRVLMETSKDAQWKMHAKF
jgi:hypothetical protein